MTVAQPNSAATILRRSFHGRLPVHVPGWLIAAALATAILFSHNPLVLHGDLVDTDSYMHLVRLRALVADGAWHGGSFTRDNAPFGMVLHWTKAYDLIFLGLAAPIAALVGWASALTWVAPAIGPVTIFALILAAAWAAAPICDTTERRLIGIVLALAPMVLVDGSIGDADHHVMVVAAWLLFMGFALRVAMGGSLRQGLGAGLAAAFALWLSVECILGVALGIALMGLAWVREGEGLRRVSLGFAATFALAMVLLLALDAPYGGWLQAEPDRLSILYVAFALLLALLWGGLAAAPQRAETWRARLGVAAAGAVLSAICLAALFPGVFAPEHAVFGAGGDRDVLFWDAANEMQPAFQSPAAGILLIGGPAIGLATALALAWRQRRVAAGAAWAFFALMLALLGALGVRHGRFVIYPEVLAALPIAVLVTRIGPFVDAVAPAFLHLFGRVLLTAFVFIGPIFLAGVVAAATGEAPSGMPNCPVRAVVPALNDPRFMGGVDLIIMTQPTEAPELLYWTEHRVVAGPYHTNVEGLHNVIHFLTSRDDATARAIAARRGVAFVMLCAADITGAHAADPNGPELYARLLRGEGPSWLAEQPWPAGMRTDLHLYRVVSPNGGGG